MMAMIDNSTKVQLVTFYLPQFHPIPENDEWWGKGFTEWTNVARAVPRFRGHYQPHLPADLGFYDLRLAEARQAQASLAEGYGVSGFCYYHYWFRGRRLLERPFDEVLLSGEPDFPFCLCWANENWTRRWDGQEREVLLAQHYGPADDIHHIRSLASAFVDPRYIRLDGKPLFLVYRPGLLPDPAATAGRWREEYFRLTGEELFLCRVTRVPEEMGEPAASGFDAAVEFHPFRPLLGHPLPDGLIGRAAGRLRRLLSLPGRYGGQTVYDYRKYVERALAAEPPKHSNIPCVFPSWDNSARLKEAGVFINSTPALYERWLAAAIQQAQAHPVGGKALVFINAWNEWAEGAHLEPCQRWGRAYLEATLAARQASCPKQSNKQLETAG